MCTFCMHGKDPEKLSHVPKWLKPPPYLASAEYKRKYWGWEESVRGGYSKSKVNKSKIVMYI